jgi:DNA-binding transcriptional MerR regulator
MAEFYTAADIGRLYRVTDRTVRAWVSRGLLPRPRKLGPFTQSRVRWTQKDLATLDSNLAALAGAQREAA